MSGGKDQGRRQAAEESAVRTQYALPDRESLVDAIGHDGEWCHGEKPDGSCCDAGRIADRVLPLFGDVPAGGRHSLDAIAAEFSVGPERLMTNLADAAGRLLAARQELTEATDAAQAAAREAVGRGVSEVEVARRLGVARMTVRKWLGKDQA